MFIWQLNKKLEILAGNLKIAYIWNSLCAIFFFLVFIHVYTYSNI